MSSVNYYFEIIIFKRNHKIKKKSWEKRGKVLLLLKKSLVRLLKIDLKIIPLKIKKKNEKKVWNKNKRSMIFVNFW